MIAIVTAAVLGLVAVAALGYAWQLHDANQWLRDENERLRRSMMHYIEIINDIMEDEDW